MYSPQDLSPQTAENLQQRIQALASLMSQVAESLHQGEPVELQHLANEIESVQATVQNLSKQLEEHPLLADSEREATCLNDIIESCKLINTRQRAIDQLKRLQLVKSFDAADQESFEQLQSQLEMIFHRLTTGTLEQRQQAMQNVLGEDAAVQMLYELIDRPEDLSDERWAKAQAMITDTFGRSVAIAVIRGRAR
ncbi:MAG: hypothetical protein JKY95_00645 [Planctomycetaceae bacterium]|nr:hypothetical protein [Planctomycetaceae bacterium]